MKYLNIILLLLLFSCSHESLKQENSPKIKNIILIIGDGMGPQQLELLQLYAKYAKNSQYKNRQTNFERMAKTGDVGLVEVNPPHFLVTDSACSATQYATGAHSLPETIGLNVKGEKVQNITSIAKKLGKSTGIVSDTRITHATPASFIAYSSNRKYENEIAEQFANSDLDVILGGGLRHFLPKNAQKNDKLKKLIPTSISLKSKRFDNKNLLDDAKNKGFKLLFTKDDLINNDSPKVMGLFKNSALPDGIDYRSGKEKNVPGLKDMAQAAIKQLSKNPKGFFLMIESGQIDWAGHQNDAGLMLAEMHKMDEMLGAVLKWANKRDDTLVVITADHETGSFGFSYNALINDKTYPVNKKIFKNGVFIPKFNYGEYSVLDRLNKQSMSFAKISSIYSSLPKEKQTAKFIKDIVNKHSDFKIDLKAAKRIIKNKKNPFYHKNHQVLNKLTVPAIVDFSPFYPIDRNAFASLIGREVSGEQHTVWGTGSHTSTPIVLVAHGPKSVTQRFNGIHHNTEIGKLLQEILRN